MGGRKWRLNQEEGEKIKEYLLQQGGEENKVPGGGVHHGAGRGYLAELHGEGLGIDLPYGGDPLRLP
jgi:hypothetical protein